jgi:hypothetical protein
MPKTSVVLIIAAIIAIAAAPALISSSSDQASPAHKHKMTSEKGLVNVIAWYVPGGKPHEAEVVKYSKSCECWIRSIAVSFKRTPNGVRLNMSPEAEVVRGDLRYTYAPYGHVVPGHIYPQWDGKELAPLVRTITTNNGNQRQLSLKEIYLRIYDPRFPDSTKMGG